MDDTERDTDPSNDSFMERMKESPRTVSALIIILIVAAAIYAFSGDRNQAPNDSVPAGEVQSEEEGSDNESEEAGEEVDEETPAADNSEATQSTTSPAASRQAATVAPVSEETLNNQAKELPSEERADNAYVEKATAGEGITHLSRKAATRWLATNEASYTLTQEHRIYIEDYIQNRLGTQSLAIGEQHTISFDLIKEAVESAGGLSDQQLRNLSRYTSALR